MLKEKLSDLEPFVIKDCSLICISTGIKAYILAELLEHLREIDEGCLYYHFWARQLRPSFDHPEFHNDFAAWAYKDLHDWILAERLNLILPQEFSSMEELKEELINIIEERIDEGGDLPWRKASSPFYFVKGQIIVFDTGKRLYTPEELSYKISSFSQGSIFYHFIDARRRTSERIDDFQAWLKIFPSSYKELISSIASMDPFFLSLVEIKNHLTQIFQQFFQRRGTEWKKKNY